MERHTENDDADFYDQPVLFITPLLFYAGLAFPRHAHYFYMISSIHAGYCLPDLLFALHLVKAPKSCLIDQESDGFDILVKKCRSLDIPLIFQVTFYLFNKYLVM